MSLSVDLYACIRMSLTNGNRIYLKKSVGKCCPQHYIPQTSSNEEHRKNKIHTGFTKSLILSLDRPGPSRSTCLLEGTERFQGSSVPHPCRAGSWWFNSCHGMRCSAVSVSPAAGLHQLILTRLIKHTHTHIYIYYYIYRQVSTLDMIRM